MVKRSDITDLMICEAIQSRRNDSPSAIKALVESTGAPEGVVVAAMKRAVDRGILDYGISLNFPWLTDAGFALWENRPR